MKQLTLYSVMIVLLTFSGCKPFYKIVFGIKNPGFENEASIKEWTKKMELPDVPVYTYSSESWKTKSQLPLNELFIFDKSGNYISYKNPANPDCSGPANLFLSYLDSTGTYEISNQYNLKQITDSLKTLDCKNANYIPQKNVDFHIFITFAIYAGKYNVNHNAKKWIAALEKNTGIRYELILINKDLQDCWNDSEKKYFEMKN